MSGAAPVSALSVRSLRAGYGRGGDIVHGIDLDQPPGTILAIIGPNGSGKSTFVKALAGLLRPRAGSIRVTGRDVTGLSAARRVAAGIAYVPQEKNVFATLTVRENMQLATEFLRRRAGTGPEQEARVLALFPELAARARTLAGNLSGGQRQMVAFAGALLANPEVLILDEPSAGLSPRFVSETMEAIARVRAAGTSILLVEQNVRAALRIADTVVVLVAGRKSLEASAGEIRPADLADLFFARAA
ncbi:ABC transporter ATP-binding protein [uncultured Methylobacterium sp.]|uniref:ABC transporter ATP-binding protein n=1 Tax=uncultured Methylobacterium sp. TaxID=157278 RepID=UPI0035CBF619